MRVLVCGGRDYSDADYLNKFLDDLHRGTAIKTVIHGGASGADTLAGLWARSNGIEEACFMADWSKGRSAGPIRNKRMLTEGKPDYVVAFAGGRGTQNMVLQAEAAGVPVLKALRTA